jgi:hypothetical protein
MTIQASFVAELSKVSWPAATSEDEKTGNGCRLYNVFGSNENSRYRHFRDKLRKLFGREFPSC